MDDIGFDLMRPQPARQPEAVAPRLIGDGDAFDGAPSSHRLLPPAMQELQEPLLVDCELLQRLAFDSRHDAGNEPAGLAHLDHRDHGRILPKGDEGSAQVIWLSHRALHRLLAATMVPSPSRAPYHLNPPASPNGLEPALGCRCTRHTYRGVRLAGPRVS